MRLSPCGEIAQDSAVGCKRTGNLCGFNICMTSVRHEIKVIYRLGVYTV